MDHDDEDDDLGPRDDDMPGGDWQRVPAPIITARSTPADIDAVVAAWTRMGLDGLRDQLEADADFTDRGRAALLARAAALLEPAIRANVEHMHASMLAVH